MKRTVRQRYSAPWALLLLAALPAAACSNGGGGGDGVPPVFIGASFAGPGASPAPGDQLLLSFSEEVTVGASAAIGDSQLLISGGGTLGSSTTVLDQPTTRSVRLLLGTGVVFQPGTSTVVFAATNDAIRDLAGNLGLGGDPVVIDATDGAAPIVTNLTLNDIDDILNGTGPAGGSLQVPSNGFLVDLTYGDFGSPGAPLGVDPARTQITANVAVSTASGSQAAGTNLLAFLTAVTATPTVGSYSVPAAVTFPNGAVTLTAVVVDQGGLAAPPVTFAFTVRAFSDGLQPFETNVNSQQLWFLDTARDIESFTTSVIPGGVSVDVVAGQNGRSDFVDILFVLGLQTQTPIPNVSGSDDSNAVVLSRLRSEMLGDLATLFAGANVAFTFTQPPGSFGSNSSVAYNSLGYSQICLAGSDDAPALGILGVAQLDPSNQRQNNDCLLESQAQNTSRLGVFLHTIADSGLGPPSASTFRVDFGQFAPAFGTPIGQDAQDGQRLLGTVGDTREARIDVAIDRLARFVAVVVAHECGHSMGLVVNGAMPLGLYGGDNVNFPGSNDGHIRTQALFPSGATNVMSPQLSYELCFNLNTAFNSLNLAYLREQAFYGN